MTDVQVKAIVDTIKSFAAHEFGITPYWDLKESFAIADRIFGALILAGWKHIIPDGGSALFGGIAGVLVYVYPDADEQAKKAADSLVSALTKEGVASELRKQNARKNQTNKLQINVGTKP